MILANDLEAVRFKSTGSERENILHSHEVKGEMSGL